MLNRFNFLLSIHAQWQSFMKDPLRIETELGILWQMGREAIAVNPVYHEISGIAGFHRLLYCHRHIDISSFILLYNLWSWNQNKRSLTVSMAGFAMTFGVDFCPKLKATLASYNNMKPVCLGSQPCENNKSRRKILRRQRLRSGNTLHNSTAPCLKDPIHCFYSWSM